MAYDSTMKKITAPVSIRDLQQCFGLSHTDLGTLIANAAINKWAKYKPVVNTAKDTVSGQWDATNQTWSNSALWFVGNNGNSDIYRFGMRFPMTYSGGVYNNTGTISITTGSSYTTRRATAGFFYDLANDSLRWTQQKPTGGDSAPFRLQDFAGYVTNAVSPLPFTTTRSAIVSQAGAYNYIADSLEQVLGGLELEDLTPPPPYQSAVPSLGSMYLGVLFYNQAKTDFFWKTSDYSLMSNNAKKMRVALVDSEILQKINASNKWYARAFLCSKPLTWCQQMSSYDSPLGYLIACDEAETSTTFVVSSTITINVSAKRTGRLRTQTYASVINGLSSSVTLTNIRIELLTESIDGYDVEQSKSFSNTTIASGATAEFENIFTEASLATHVRFIATNGSTTVSEIAEIVDKTT